MLPALAEREAELTGLLAIAGEDRTRLAPQVDEVVQQHQPDGDGNDDEVEDFDEVKDAAAGSGFGEGVDRADGEAAAGVRVALAAGLAQIRVIDRGAWVARRINIVDAMAAGAVGDGLAAFVRGESVVAILIGGDAIPGHGEAGHQLCVGMAAGAGLLRDVGHVDGGSRVARGEDAVLTVAVGAGSGLQNAFGDGLTMNALRVGVVHARVAVSAGGGDVLLPDLRFRIGDGQDVVGAMAVIARSGVSIAVQNRPPVNALLVRLDGTHLGEHIFRRELRIGVAGPACIRQMLLAHG